MLIDYDHGTVAAMAAALDVVCKKIPEGLDTTETRTAIADAITKSAETGEREFHAFIGVGMAVLNEMHKPAPKKKFNWFGLRRE